LRKPFVVAAALVALLAISDNIVRAGLNYRFGAPVIGKY
jgi:hypothetical protein